MCQQEPPCDGYRRRLSRAQDDMLPDSLGPCVNRCRGRRRIGFGMDAHLTEVMTEARLHERSSRSVEWLPG